MKIYNTLTRTIEELKPLIPPEVRFYACGPTVYDFTHIGHVRKYIMDDVLKRTLTYVGYQVKHVMNITDVGHLSGDDDTGEDKLEKGAKKTGKTVWDVARFYTDFFHKTMEQVNILPPNTEPWATECVTQMIELIQRLEKSGATYETDEAVYFDVETFPQYGRLSGQSLEEKKQAVREEVYADAGKKNPADFVLWFKRVGRFESHIMHWPSPWGDGFPGWHIECSAMAMQHLGEQIDIHSGGIDHIPVHHENEIAQSETATGKRFSQIWVHHYFLNVEGEKMSKSKGNFTTLDDVKKKGVHPLAVRLLFLQTHYRQGTNFTWESVHGADHAYKKLVSLVRELKRSAGEESSDRESDKARQYRQTFREEIENDLQIPQAVALMWQMFKDNSLTDSEKYTLVLSFDEVFGLGLGNIQKEEIPEEITRLAEERKQAKEQKDYQKADKLREAITQKGYTIEDKAEGYVIKSHS